MNGQRFRQQKWIGTKTEQCERSLIPYGLIVNVVHEFQNRQFIVVVHFEKFELCLLRVCRISAILKIQNSEYPIL